MSICVVIPAAGRGSRLGIEVPKILAPLGPHLTVWDVLCTRCEAIGDHVHVVLAPNAVEAFTKYAKLELEGERVSYSLQPEPLGMGDAVFRARDVFTKHGAIIVMWGDQVGLQRATLTRVADALRTALAANERAVVLPLATTPNPYVEYRFDHAGRVASVQQSREGDTTSEVGATDVGVFGLTTAGLVEAWIEYSARGIVGAKTKEANFLPFMPFLALERGYRTVRLDGIAPDEARGLNTPEDLAYFQDRFRHGETA